MKALLLTLFACLAYTTLIADQLNVAGQPSMGNPQAPVQVVAFLEPKCPDSKRYYLDSFPSLKADYIDTNKINYTVITTSFLYKSMPAAIALLNVYHQDPNRPRSDLFFAFLDYIYKNQPPEKQDWATLDTILKFAAKASPDIGLENLENGIKNGRYKDQVEKNTAYGNQLMGHLSTPTLFVNGVKVANKNDTVDYGNLRTAIQKALQTK